ncbi:MAG: D-glycero-beta-D-manno-heptose 1-phosphate adenylyltransferase [candidate division Zixibacteria bacterium]|nr:D-glycero-beta-D-manno-heptose 1-phosphate adenylyltransferase [candidate division Zixibacteria bacterium]
MGKIVGRTGLKQILNKLRAARKRIVFTNGCFDLIHVGHVRYLKKARQMGDLLILGLNSDQSVRKLKGPSRPIISQNDRAEILSALEPVDYIVIFNELTPLNLIRRIRPDILVKGSDYKTSQIVGRDYVLSHGGRVKTVPIVRNKSTKNLVKTVITRYGRR